MNLPFSVPRPNMQAFRVDRTASARNPNAERDEFDDRQPLSPRPGDLEAQAPEMAERPHPASRFLARLPRPTMPSFLSSNSSSDHRRWRGVSGSPPRPRPSSSHYSGEGNGDEDEDVESPKTPRFTLTIPNMPSTRLHLPNLTRTWTQGSNGPPSRPATAHGRRPSRSDSSGGRFPVSVAGVAEPAPAVTTTRGAAGQQQHARTDSRARTRFDGADPAELHLADLAEQGRRRRRRRGHHRRDGSDRSRGSRRSDEDGGGGEEEDGGAGEQGSRRRRRQRQRDRAPPPKHFLFCFPWIKSRRIRSQILRCFVSGLFLALLLTVYLSLTITKNITNNEFTVLLILIILFVTIFFCHGLIRLCMFIVKGPPPDEGSGSSSSRRLRGAMLPEMLGPGGYAIPRQPIRVVLARDEEAVGIESEATKSNPPAYGLWRGSVRVDPNRIYWMRNEESATAETIPEATDSNSSGSGSGGSSNSSNDGSGSSSSTGNSSRDDEPPRPATARPPSYMSDDGVEYVVEAQPRLIVPAATEGPPVPHPAEVGRVGRPSAF